MPSPLRDTPEEWRITATRTPFIGNKTRCRTDSVVMPDGTVANRDYQVHPGSVAVLALDDQDRVLVLRQYRHPVRQRLWEIPAGLLDVAGENPLEAARRELYEEAHVKAEDWRVLLDKYLWANAEVLRDRPADMTIGMHLCRGNYRGHWIGSGGYEPVAEKLFGQRGVDVFLLEYDSERAGDFRPLRFVPEAKHVVLGLVSSKTAALENPVALRRRIYEAALSLFVPLIVYPPPSL